MKQLTSRIHLMWTAAVALACLTLLSACSKDDDEQKTPQTRTVLVYMSGENNLLDYAEADLKEIMDASIQPES